MPDPQDLLYPPAPLLNGMGLSGLKGSLRCNLGHPFRAVREEPIAVKLEIKTILKKCPHDSRGMVAGDLAIKGEFCHGLQVNPCGFGVKHLPECFNVYLLLQLLSSCDYILETIDQGVSAYSGIKALTADMRQPFFCMAYLTVVLGEHTKLLILFAQDDSANDQLAINIFNDSSWFHILIQLYKNFLFQAA